MRLSKINLIIILVIISAVSLYFTSAVYSDSQNGWKGYSLYNVNNSKITIVNEDVSIELTKDKLHYNGEFIIRNTANSETRAALGMPANGIERISMMEKGTYVKWKKRSLNSMQNEFGIDIQLPQEDYWYIFNLTLAPMETRIIDINLDAAQQLSAEGIYTVSYFDDRKSGFANKVEKSSLYIKVDDFEPYNILSVKGIDPDEMGKKGELLIETDVKNIEMIAIQYKPVVDQAVEKLLRGTTYKARAIGAAFREKDYEKAASLCDEYMKDSKDNQLNKEQISFIKAESLRKLHKLEKYLEIAETLDYGKLYPAELKNKIYLDRMNAYLSQQNKEKIRNLSKELYQQSDESSEFLASWMDGNGYFSLSQNEKEQFLKDKANESGNTGRLSVLLHRWYLKPISKPYTPPIVFVIGLLTGLFLKQGKSRKRKKKSMYIYRM